MKNTTRITTVTASISFEPDLLAKVDARARSLNINRTQYLARLARLDLGLSSDTLPTITPEKAKAG